MSFWSSQTLQRRLEVLVDKPSEVRIDCNAIELRVGGEYYVTPEKDDANKTTKEQLSPGKAFLIPPGQFAFLLTEEIVKVPVWAMAFISMKATFKQKGLVNVSGFHVDPGWCGPLVFAVYNAGPAPVHLERGLRLFLIWYADLDQDSEKRKIEPGPMGIPTRIINDLTGGTDTIYAIERRIKEEVKGLEAKYDDMRTLVHKVDKAQTRLFVTGSVLLTLVGGLVVYAFRHEIVSCAGRLITLAS